MTLLPVAVLSLGGTISSTKSGGPGVTPRLTGEELVEAVPELAEIAEVSASSFHGVPGSELTIDDVVALSEEVKARLDGGAAGVVVTQGTDSIEETSFLLDLLVDREEPVVVTGAMRNPTLPGADGPANLLSSVRVAASGAARGLGAVVVFNDEIHAARYVQKTHASNPATFSSPWLGPLGWISEETVRVAVRPVGRYHVSLPEGSRDRPVALYTVGLGDDGRMLPELARLGYEGLVLEAFGGGHVPSGMVEHLENLALKMPVVLATRTRGGEVLGQTYGFPGSETDLLSRGLASAGPLVSFKARLLLSLLLRSGASKDAVAETFEQWTG